MNKLLPAVNEYRNQSKTYLTDYVDNYFEEHSDILNGIVEELTWYLIFKGHLQEVVRWRQLLLVYENPCPSFLPTLSLMTL
jgi:hypothetical protein